MMQTLSLKTLIKSIFEGIRRGVLILLSIRTSDSLASDFSDI